jgi:predicted transcriptional regulator
MVESAVDEVMDPPLETVDVLEDVESLIGPLLGDDTALIATQGTNLVGVITRSDLLEYIAHTREVRRG